MSNDIAIFKGGLPAYLKDAVDPVTSSLAGGTGGGMRRISIKGQPTRLVLANALQHKKKA